MYFWYCVFLIQEFIRLDIFMNHIYITVEVSSHHSRQFRKTSDVRRTQMVCQNRFLQKSKIRGRTCAYSHEKSRASSLSGLEVMAIFVADSLRAISGDFTRSSDARRDQRVGFNSFHHKTNVWALTLPDIHKKYGLSSLSGSKVMAIFAAGSFCTF